MKNKREPLIEIPDGVKIGKERKKYQRYSIAEIIHSASGGLMSVKKANILATSWASTAIENKKASKKTPCLIFLLGQHFGWLDVPCTSTKCVCNKHS